MKKALRFFVAAPFVLIAAVFAGAIALEWAIFGLWLLPAVGGVYFFMREDKYGPRLADKFAGATLMLLSWPWALLLTYVLAPMLPPGAARLIGVTLSYDESGSYTGLPLALSVIPTVLGAVGLTYYVAGIASRELEEYEQRIGRYRLVARSIAVVPVFLGMMLDMVAFGLIVSAAILVNTWAETSFPDDPKLKLAKFFAGGPGEDTTLDASRI